MTSQQIFDNLQEIRDKLVTGVHHQDLMYIKMQINNIDTLLYHMQKDTVVNPMDDNLWELGTCWVKSPAVDKITTHQARRNKETGAVQFNVENEYHKDGSYWIDFGKGWWNNFVPTN